MKNMPQRLSDLAGLLLAVALLALLASSLLHHAQALLWMPAFLRTVNISLLHQFAADALIAMCLLAAARAAWLPLPRWLIILGLLLASLLIISGLWQAYLSLSEAANLRLVFCMIPVSAAMMLCGFLAQLQRADARAQNYFPLDMKSGGIKMALLFGAGSFIWAVFKLGADWTVSVRYFFDSLDQFTLMTVPFLVLASVMMNPARRSGNIVPFALLALLLSVLIGVSPGRFFFALMVPAAMVALCLWFAQAKNSLRWQNHFWGQWFMYGAVSALFIGAMLIAYVSLAEGAALAAVVVFAAHYWLEGRSNTRAIGKFFSDSAAQSGSWLFSGAMVLVGANMVGDLNWLSKSAEEMTWLKTQPIVFLLALCLPVSTSAYFIGPIAATIIAATFLVPVATGLSVSPVQLGVMILLNVALVKVLHAYQQRASSNDTTFRLRRALLSTLVVIVLVAWMPKLSLRLPLYIFGGAG